MTWPETCCWWRYGLAKLACFVSLGAPISLGFWENSVNKSSSWVQSFYIYCVNGDLVTLLLQLHRGWRPHRLNSLETPSQSDRKLSASFSLLLLLLVRHPSTRPSVPPSRSSAAACCAVLSCAMRGAGGGGPGDWLRRRRRCTNPPRHRSPSALLSMFPSLSCRPRHRSEQVAARRCMRTARTHRRQRWRGRVDSRQSATILCHLTLDYRRDALKSNQLLTHV